MWPILFCSGITAWSCQYEKHRTFKILLITAIFWILSWILHIFFTWLLLFEITSGLITYNVGQLNLFALTRKKLQLKLSQNKKDLNDVTASPIWVSFSQLPAAKNHQKQGSCDVIKVLLISWRLWINSYFLIYKFLFLDRKLWVNSSK